jgi:hypothetical protein
MRTVSSVVTPWFGQSHQSPRVSQAEQEETQAASRADLLGNGKRPIAAGCSADSSLLGTEPCLALGNAVTNRVLASSLKRRRIRHVQMYEAMLHVERIKTLTFSLRDYRQLHNVGTSVLSTVSPCIAALSYLLSVAFTVWPLFNRRCEDMVRLLASPSPQSRFLCCRSP